MRYEFSIFDLFYTNFDKQTDPNKDANGKGTQERYMEVVGSTIDETLVDIETLNENLLVPATRLSRMVPYKEVELGYRKEWIWFFEEPIAFRRYLAGIMPLIYQIRHTPLCLEVMFRWIGCTYVITEDFVYDGGFDSPLILDSTHRRLDSYTNTIIDYTIDIIGPTVFPSVYTTTPAPDVVRLTHAIYTILLFNQAWNMRLTAITYNGIDIHDYINTISPMLLNTAFSSNGGFPYNLPFLLV